MVPVQITIRDIPNSTPLETFVESRAQKLSRFYNRIISCHVVIELAQKHKQHGKLYNVRIRLRIPGPDLIVTKKFSEDGYLAVRDAFLALERKLEDHSQKRHGRVKTHDEVLHGHVLKLMPDEGYGFIQGIDGNEYYFSVTNVNHHGFGSLSIGDAVEYIAGPVNGSRQAHRVIKERNHHESV